MKYPQRRVNITLLKVEANRTDLTISRTVCAICTSDIATPERTRQCRPKRAAGIECAFIATFDSHFAFRLAVSFCKDTNTPLCRVQQDFD